MSERSFRDYLLRELDSDLAESYVGGQISGDGAAIIQVLRNTQPRKTGPLMMAELHDE